MDKSGDSAKKALRKIVPWVKVEDDNELSQDEPAITIAPEIVHSQREQAWGPTPVDGLPARPPWAMAGFPATIDELLELSQLQHRTTCFRGETVVGLSLELASAGPGQLLTRMASRGITKVGDRQRLVGSLTRATRELQMAVSSLLGPSLEQRLDGLIGVNLLPLVATFPRCESAAIASAASGVAGSLSIAGVVDAISVGGVVESSMQEVLDAFKEQHLGWLSELQVDLLRTLAIFVLACVLDTGLKADGALADLQDYRLLSEAMGLLPLSPIHEAWHQALPQRCNTGPGGPMVILSPPRAHLWSGAGGLLPRSVTVIPAVMGGQLPEPTIHECGQAARRTLTRGEIGILCSNAMAWQRALDAGWEWALILEDDAHFQKDTQGTSLQSFLARLPSLIDAASAQDPDWSILVLSPVNTPYDFFKGTPAHCIPHILGSRDCLRAPQPLPKPPHHNTTRPSLPPSWRRACPTYHAFAWVYRRPLMEHCVADFAKRDPPLEPLDIWVWEVAALHGLLGHALAPLPTALIDRGANLHSIKEQQDDQRFLNQVYAERGYGK